MSNISTEFYKLLFVCTIFCFYYFYAKRDLTEDFIVDLEENKGIVFSSEVREALEARKPIVALESTIITHGMPYPKNLESALEVEQIIREGGSVPATIAIINGEIHVGLEKEEVEYLSTLKHQEIDKCSRRDLSRIISQKKNGATTVSATMIISNIVGIKVFVTGGIGGVHREVTQSFDISADLTELGRTPLCVICAGVKSILDIPKTLEYLETFGVSVNSYQSDQFPSFFTRNSNVKSPSILNSTLSIAKLIKTNIDLDLQSGIVIGVPVPEKDEAEGEKIDLAIQQALQEANEQSISGKDITPFLLQRVNELTEGHSLKSNMALIRNNAKIGSETARHLYELQNID